MKFFKREPVTFEQFEQTKKYLANCERSFLITLGILILPGLPAFLSFLKDPVEAQGYCWLYFFYLLFFGPIVGIFCIVYLAKTLVALTTYYIQYDRVERPKTVDPKPPQQKQEIVQERTSISLFLQAILSGKAEQVQAALAQDPTQLNTPYAQNGNTPLHVAVWNGYKDIVKLLLEQPGIDLHIKNKAGKTAFDLAQDKNLPEIINLLASVGNKQEEN